LSQIASFVVLFLFALPLPFFALAFLIPGIPAEDGADRSPTPIRTRPVNTPAISGCRQPEDFGSAN
jgi:hypothetical protein